MQPMDEQPLSGRRIVVTRAREQADGLVERLRALGADPLVCPAIAFAPAEDTGPLDAALRRLHQYDWLLLTSANGVRAVAERLRALGLDLAATEGLRIGAIGPATAEALAALGVRVDFMPGEYVAEAILAEIGDVAGARILLPRADIAREALAVGLRVKGAIVDEFAAYRTVPGEGAAALAALLRRGDVDAITFTSSSTVRYLLAGIEAAGMRRPEAIQRMSEAAIVCIGPITAATAREEGLQVAAEARAYTADGVVEALVSLYRP